MITIRDLQEAIAECKGERNPNANTCIKLASYYTILKYMTQDENTFTGYSFASPPNPTPNDLVEYKGDSEFAQLIKGKRSQDVFDVFNELMDTLQILYPDLYNGVIQKLT